jgi:hypothetical protein
LEKGTGTISLKAVDKFQHNFCASHFGTVDYLCRHIFSGVPTQKGKPRKSLNFELNPEKGGPFFRNCFCITVGSLKVILSISVLLKIAGSITEYRSAIYLTEGASSFTGQSNPVLLVLLGG